MILRQRLYRFDATPAVRGQVVRLSVKGQGQIVVGFTDRRADCSLNVAVVLYAEALTGGVVDFLVDLSDQGQLSSFEKVEVLFFVAKAVLFHG